MALNDVQAVCLQATPISIYKAHIDDIWKIQERSLLKISKLYIDEMYLKYYKCLNWPYYSNIVFIIFLIFVCSSSVVLCYNLSCEM